jgi:hypothetical protein
MENELEFVVAFSILTDGNVLAAGEVPRKRLRCRLGQRSVRCYLDQPDTRDHHDVGWPVTDRFASTSSLSLQPL